MDAPVPGTVRAVVAAAQRRALLASIAGKALAALPWGAGAGLACVVIDRLAPTGLPWPVLALGPVAAAGLAACGWAWMSRPGEARIARRLDAALNLKSRVASSLELAGTAAQADPAMVRLLAAQAEESARSIDVRRVFPVRIGRAWPAGPTLAALACAAGVWLPPGPWREGAASPADAASAGAGADLPALRVELAEARELLRPAMVVAEDAPARAQAQETLARVEQELAEGRADGSRARSTAAQALDLAAMEAEARARRRDEQADAALQRLAQLRQAAERAGSGMSGAGGEAGGAPGGAISESLREGDLSAAAETLRRAIDELQSLPPEARARLADELAQLARDLDAIEGGKSEIEPPAGPPREETTGGVSPTAPSAAPSAAAPPEPSAPSAPGPGAARPSGPAAEAARRALSEAGASPEQAEKALGSESPERLRESLESAGVEPERAAELADRVQREREREAARDAAREQTRRLAESAREAAEALREPPSTAPAANPATTSPPTNPPGTPSRPDARTAPTGEPRRPGATEPLTPQASPGERPGAQPRSNPSATRQPDSQTPRDPGGGPAPGASGKTEKPADGAEQREAGKPGESSNAGEPRDAGTSGESSKPGETGSKPTPAAAGGRSESATPREPSPSNAAPKQPGKQPSAKPGESPAAPGDSPSATKPEGSPSAGVAQKPEKPEGGQPGSQPGAKPAGEPGARQSEQPNGQPGGQPTATPGGEPDPQSRESPSGAPPGAQGAPSPDAQGAAAPSRPGSPQAEPGVAPRTPAGAADNQPREPEPTGPSGAPSPERAPGKQPGTTSPQGRTNAPPQGDPAAGEGAKPGEAPDLPDLPKDQRSLERLAKQIGEMADQRRRAGEDRKDAEALREMAQRWWDKASPDQRQQAERLARELARQRGSNGDEEGNGTRNGPPPTLGREGDPRDDRSASPLAARGARSNSPGPEGSATDQAEVPGRTPGSPAQRTHVVDARSKGDDAPAPAARDRVMAQWLTNRPATGESAAGDAVEARGILREAARAAQQAVDDRTLPRRYDRLLKRYFQHAPEELGLIRPAPAPPATPAPAAAPAPAATPSAPAPDKKP